LTCPAGATYDPGSVPDKVDVYPSGLSRPLAALLTLVFLAVLVRTAWISDDAAITLRTVLNVTHGFGLTFNIAERVQTFTHPLWLALLTLGYLLLRNVYVATFAVSIGFSAAAFWIASTRAASPAQAALGAVAIVFSRAFVDFSTSGLENPLSCVLLALFLPVYLRTETEGVSATTLTALWLVTALLYLTRPDDVLFVLPLLALACWRMRRPGAIVRAAFFGTLPATLWTLFAILYYGFPVPNTAYAKLGMGIDRGDLWTQGLLYLVDSIDRDPITLTTIVFAMALGAIDRRTTSRGAAAGIALYLVYIVSIGGDFMAGRFLAVPLYAAVLVLGRLITASRAVWIPATATLVVLGSITPQVPLLSDSRFAGTDVKPSGVVNERAVYFRDRSLVLAKRGTFRNPEWPHAQRALPARTRVMDTCGLMGSSGLDQGPYTYMLDECALADPLLARLPAVFNPEWRTGHYRRMIPAGYRESLESSANLIQDAGLHEYYEHLRLVTRSDRLWSGARLKTIVAINTHAYDHLINQTYFRHGGSVTDIGSLAAVKAEGTPWNADGNRVLPLPLAITCPVRKGRRYVDLTADSDDRYLLMFVRNGSLLSTLELGPIPEYRRRPGLVHYIQDVPPRAREEGFDTIVVIPLGGDEHYALGHLLVEGISAASDAQIYHEVALRDGLAKR
jgi:arabinofuranosyltransferase